MAATFPIALGLASVMLGAAGQMINTAGKLLTGRINSLQCVAAPRGWCRLPIRCAMTGKRAGVGPVEVPASVAARTRPPTWSRGRSGGYA